MGLSTIQIRPLDNDDALASAWPVVRQLRPHLDQGDLVAAWQRQYAEGYRAVGAFDDRACVGYAGYRVQHMLAHGRFLYVDDLVTDEAGHGGGVGTRLIDWLLGEAQRLGCDSLQLDSGTHRIGAHGFYFARGMHICSFHFRVEV